MSQIKKRGKASKIDLLPESLKKELDALLRDKNHTQGDILSAINELIEQAGLAEQKISKSGLSRYSVEMETVGQEIRAMRESTEMWVAQFGAKPTGETTQLLLEMLKTQHFKLLMEANSDPDKLLDAKTINSLALALNRLENAAMINLKREKEVRKAFAEELAEEVDSSAKQAGLTTEGANLIKQQILGLPNEVTPSPVTQQTKPELKLSSYQKAINNCDNVEKRFGLPVFIPFDPDEVLLGYQKRWMADESILKIAEKSRRTGLTWAEAADAVLEASKSKVAFGTNHFYVGSTKDMAREFIDACAMWAMAFDKAAGDIEEDVFIDEGQEGKEILTFTINFASGYKIQALSSNPSNLRGMQGNVTIDEAAFHDRLAEVLKAASALTMWGAKIRLISTHNGTDNLFNTLIQDSRAGKKEYSVHRITLDDACNEGLYKRISQTRHKAWNQEVEDMWKAALLNQTATEEDALEEYACVPKQGGGVYIKRVLVEQAMKKDIPIIRFTAPSDFLEWSAKHKEIQIKEWQDELKPHLAKLNKDLNHAFGEDFARKGDLSVFVPLQINRDLTKRVPFLLEMSNLTYDAQREILFYLCDRLPRLQGLAFDATGNGGYLAESAALRYGTDMVEQVMLTERWYMEWMPKLKAEFEDLNLDIPRHQDVLDDMGQIKVINGVPKVDKGSTKGTDGRQRHGDVAVGLVMAVRASWMDGGVIEYTPLPQKDRDEEDDDFPSNKKGAW